MGLNAHSEKCSGLPDSVAAFRALKEWRCGADAKASFAAGDQTLISIRFPFAAAEA